MWLLSVQSFTSEPYRREDEQDSGEAAGRRFTLLIIVWMKFVNLPVNLWSRKLWMKTRWLFAFLELFAFVTWASWLEHSKTLRMRSAVVSCQLIWKEPQTGSRPELRTGQEAFTAPGLGGTLLWFSFRLTGSAAARFLTLTWEPATGRKGQSMNTTFQNKTQKL